MIACVFKELISDLTVAKQGREPSDQAAGSASKAAAEKQEDRTDESEREDDKGSSPRKGGGQRKQHTINAGALVVPEQYPYAVSALLVELAKINVRTFPNLTFLGIRAALEKSIKAYAEAKSSEIRPRHNSKGYVQLSHALDWLLEDVKANGPTKLRQPIERVRTGKLTSYAHTKDALNAVNHNHDFTASSDEAVDMWNAIEPIMKHLMKP